jgi:hypothetical protein
MRCYVFDNHRPFHLKNVYSRHNVVVFDERMVDEEDEDDIPSQASEMSSQVSDSDLDSMKSEEDVDDVFSDEEGEEANEEGEAEAEFNPDEVNENEENEEAEEVEDTEEKGDEDNEEADEAREEEEKEDNDAVDENQDNEGEEVEEIEGKDGPRNKNRIKKVQSLEDDDSIDEVEEGSVVDADKTFVKEWKDDSSEVLAEDEGSHLDTTRNLDDVEETEQGEYMEAEGDVEEDEEEDYNFPGKRKRGQTDGRKFKRQKIQQYYRRCKKLLSFQ